MSDLETKTSQVRVLELDALRGIAALAVVVFHYAGHGQRYFGFPVTFPVGQYGVQLFFVISGFVIFYSLERTRRLRDFAFSRVTRLYPTYWAALGLVLIVELAIYGEKPWVGGYVVNATMLQKFLGFSDIDIVFWTLAVELTFYVWMGIMFVTGLLRQMTLVAVLWLGLATAWPLLRHGESGPDLIGTYLILSHIPYFIAGIMLYRLRVDGMRISHLGVILLAWAVAAFSGGAVGATVAGSVFAIFALAVSGRLRFLATPVMIWLGSVSYALYVIHHNLGYRLLGSLNAAGLNSVTAFGLTVVAALILATAITFGLERPVMRVARGWYRSRYPRQAE